MKKLLAPWVLLAGLVLFGGGCVDTGAIVVTGLQINLTGLERASDGTITVNWDVVNPNVRAYLLAQVKSKIYVNGTYVGSMLETKPIGVPARDKASRTTPLTLTNAAAGSLLAGLAGQGPANYRTESNITVQIYGDDDTHGDLSSTGSVAIVNK